MSGGMDKIIGKSNTKAPGAGLRREDLRLLTGKARFSDDIHLPGEAVAVVVRSPYPNAKITAVDTSAAAAGPGVVAVFTGEDVASSGVGLIHPRIPVADIGNAGVVPAFPVLAMSHVRYVGEGVALVIAETEAQARAAAELVDIDYEILPAVIDPVVACGGGAPQIWQEAPGNRCFLWRAGDFERAQAAIDAAAHVTRLSLPNNRLFAAYLEGRAAIGAYDEAAEQYLLYTNTQTPHMLRAELAVMLNVAGHRVRVIVPEMGGAFGAKGPFYPEQALVLWSARRLGRPVRWIGERTEGFLADVHSRDTITDAELAFDAGRRITAVRIRTVANLGAYVATHGAFIPVSSLALYNGVYRVPVIGAEVEGVFTNTVPVDAYRGAGRPEIVFVVERLIEQAARELDCDPIELRRLNMIAPSELPYRTHLGWTYDVGHFEANLNSALERAGRSDFNSRREAARARGRLAGFGVSVHMDRTAGGALDEFGQIRFDPSGSVTALTGTMASGQGHETAFAQIVADSLGVPIDAVRVVQGDTAQISTGTGTFGSRSLVVGGSALLNAADKVIAKATRIAAHRLEAAESDIAYETGVFRVRGTDRSISIAGVARVAFVPQLLPPGMEAGLDEKAAFRPNGYAFTNGCHACEVEVDPETGTIDIVRYTAVDDFGCVMQPASVEAQVVGGIAQGIGQALLEQIVYDKESGQLITASFTDYTMPRASDMPPITVAFQNEPVATNRMGAKGCGESGTIAAPPAVVNAVLDALRPLGVHALDMPLTPDRVWTAIQAAGRPSAE
jgi:carbon-monoxide dehydrogenase large subunit